MGSLFGIPPQLGAGGRKKTRQIAFLHFPVAFLPILAEHSRFGIVQCAAAAQVIEHTRHAVAQAFRRQAQTMRFVLNPRRGLIQPIVFHLQPAPRFQTTGLPGSEGGFAKHLKAQVLAAFLLMANARAFVRRELPHFRGERTGKCRVLRQLVVQEPGEVADGLRPGLDALRHQRAQTEASGMVAHPTGLKRSILAVVAEHQEARAFGAMHHVLGEHMHVRHGDGPHWPRRFAVAAMHHAPVGTAR